MNVLDDYSSFMVFELKDSGEGERVNITEKEFSKDNANKILHDSQVVLIVKEDLRRIYIWKGHQSTVRKKFIASRVAQSLQQELTYSANFHRCKIVSVDQGEEPLDFLNSFGLKSQKITKTEEINQLKFTTLNYPKSQPKFSEKPKNIHIEPSKEVKKRLHTSNNNILSRILQIESPEGYIRNHILIGNNTLYGIVVKKTEIFGKSIEESEWNSINDFSNSIMELSGHKLRIHFNNKLNFIEAIEILEKKTSEMDEEVSKQSIDYNKWTVKQLKSYCSENCIKVPSSYRKAQIIELVDEFDKTNN